MAGNYEENVGNSAIIGALAFLMIQDVLTKSFFSHYFRTPVIDYISVKITHVYDSISLSK